MSVKNLPNRLWGMRAYLIGPMDQVDDLGRGWRLDMQSFLWDLNCGVFNPADKATDYAMEDDELHRQLKSLRKKISESTDINVINLCYEEIERLMNDIVAVDFAMVDRSDFIVMYIDKDYHMCGSYSEETLAVIQKKPVIICCKQGKHDIPGFCFKRKGRHNMMFGSWGEVKDYLVRVNQDPLFVDPSRTWKFFNYHKVYEAACFIKNRDLTWGAV